jgi:hypothetical protein
MNTYVEPKGLGSFLLGLTILRDLGGLLIAREKPFRHLPYPNP